MNDTGASTFKTSSVFNIPSFTTVWNRKRLFETGGVDTLRAKKGSPSMTKSNKQQPVKGSEEALRKKTNAYVWRTPTKKVTP
jgi:hypothetical protein